VSAELFHVILTCPLVPAAKLTAAVEEEDTVAVPSAEVKKVNAPDCDSQKMYAR
jgi:hypothetical protein